MLDARDRRRDDQRAGPRRRQRGLRRAAQRRRRRPARRVLHARPEEARGRRGRPGGRAHALARRAGGAGPDRSPPAGGTGRAGVRAAARVHDRRRPEHAELPAAVARVEAAHRSQALARPREAFGGGGARAPRDGGGGPRGPPARLRHDQLQRGQRAGRRLRRDHHQRALLEDPGPRGRLPDPRRRPVRGRRGGRGGLHRPRRGEPLQPGLVPDRGRDAPRQGAEGRRAGSAAPHPREHRREAAAQRGRQPGLLREVLRAEPQGRTRGRRHVREALRQGRRPTRSARKRAADSCPWRACWRTRPACDRAAHAGARSGPRAPGWATGSSRRRCGRGRTRRWRAAAGAGHARLPEGRAVPAHGHASSRGAPSP